MLITKTGFHMTFKYMRNFANFPLFYIRGGEIWVKEKVQPLKIINALFLKPHILCDVCFS